MTGAALRPRALHVVVYGGLAAGLLGKEAFAGGTDTAFGIAAWLAMTYVVVPLSRATPPPFILVGLLFAYLARWSANRR